MAPFGLRAFVAVPVVALLSILPSYGEPPGSQPAVSGPAATSQPATSSRDHLLGWYELPYKRQGKVMPGPATLIPVLKIDGTYHSVCKGAEIPLKECAEGLEWGFQPSSMAGTKIGLDEKSGEVYLAIVDTRAADDWYEPGRKQPMRKIDRPAWLLDAAAPVPQTNNDFVGWYQLSWLPYLRYQVRKEDNKYIIAPQRVRQNGAASTTQPGGQTIRENVWEATEPPREATPLPDRLGFVLGATKKAMHLTYNKVLKRFELETSGPGDLVLRMPLTRVPAPPSPQQDAAPLPKARIGIPSW